MAPARCSRCGGPFYRNVDEEPVCLLCGEVLYRKVDQADAADPDELAAQVRRRGRPRGTLTANQRPPDT